MESQPTALPGRDPLRFELANSLAICIDKLQQSGSAPSTAQCAEWIERPPESRLGDHAFPCFRLAASLRQAPPKIAQALKEQLLAQPPAGFERCEVVGAYLNVFWQRSYLAQHVLSAWEGDAQQLRQGRVDPAASAEPVMIEFSQPNTHKDFHVGHCRNALLGDSLVRLYRSCGYQVVAANYIGDEGTHVAKCLWGIRSSGEEPPENAPAAWYGRHYAAAHERLSQAEPAERAKMEAEIAAILADLEARRGDNHSLWERSREDCMRDFLRIYKWLGVHFDKIFFESEVSEESQAIVDEFIAKGLFVESDGAYGIDMDEWGLGYFMARKSDGSSLYITKDLALARRKFATFGIERSIYVVGCEQNLHFQQLFKALELMGFEQAKRCYHLSYAHVTLPEGKMSSRGGKTVTFDSLRQLISAEIEPVLRKYEGKWSSAEIAAATDTLCQAAVKYAMLATDSQKEICFDPVEWTSFEGQSGVYLLYGYARARSIISSAAEAGASADLAAADRLQSDSEHQLLKAMYEYNNTISQARASCRPSVLAQYLYRLAKHFNRFYAQESVLRTEDQQLRSARLALVQVFCELMKDGLQHLGIDCLERM